MMNNNLYTAVGKFHIKGSVGGMRCPLVTLGGGSLFWICRK